MYVGAFNEGQIIVRSIGMHGTRLIHATLNLVGHLKERVDGSWIQ